MTPKRAFIAPDQPADSPLARNLAKAELWNQEAGGTRRTVIPGREHSERTRNLEISGSMLRIAPK
jgi:hypothetical protein